MATNELGFTPAQELERKNQDRTDSLRATLYSLIALSTLAVLLRVISRRVGRIRLWWDDYLTFAALVFAIGLNASLLLGNYHGLGKHAEFAGMAGVLYNARIVYAAELIYVTSMTLVKIAILLFYYRIFKVSQRFLIAIWVMGTVIICWYLTSVLVGCFQCYPARFLWDRKIPGGQCIPEDALWIGSSVSSLVTDAAILALPMPIIWRMRVTWRQRIAVSALLLLGSFVCVTSILRLTTIHQLSITDSTYTNVDSAIWTSVECSVAVISACLPTLKPLFRGLFYPGGHANSPSPNGWKGREGSESSNPSISPSAQWRSAANEKRICNLDTSEFRRCDTDPNSSSSSGNHGGDLPPQLPPVQHVDFRDVRGVAMNNGMFSDGTPRLHGWDRV